VESVTIGSNFAGFLIAYLCKIYLPPAKETKTSTLARYASSGVAGLMVSFSPANGFMTMTIRERKAKEAYRRLLLNNPNYKRKYLASKRPKIEDNPPNQWWPKMPSRERLDDLYRQWVNLNGGNDL
jgi:hypothetical protein